MVIISIIYPFFDIPMNPNPYFFELAGAVKNRYNKLLMYDLNSTIHEKKEDLIWKIREFVTKDAMHNDSFRIFLEEYIRSGKIDVRNLSKNNSFILGFKNLLNYLEDYIKQNKIFLSQFVVFFIKHITQLPVALVMSAQLRRKMPSIKIIYTGLLIENRELAAKYLIKYNFADYVIQADYISILPELIDNLINSTKKQKIDKIITKNEFGDSCLIFHHPPFHGEFDSKSNSGFFPVLINTGCVGRCNFCEYNNLESVQRGIIVKNFSNLIAEITSLHNQGISNFHFSSFSINSLGEKKLLELINSIQNLNFFVKWTCQFRLEDNISLSILKKMKDAGCVEIQGSIESASLRMQRILNKNLSLRGIENLMRKIQTAGISFKTQFIVGHPKENFEDFKKTISFIIQGKEYISEMEVSPYYLTEHDLEQYFKVGTGIPEDIFRRDYKQTFWVLKNNSFLDRTAKRVLLELIFCSGLNNSNRNTLSQDIAFLRENAIKVLEKHINKDISLNYYNWDEELRFLKCSETKFLDLSKFEFLCFYIFCSHAWKHFLKLLENTKDLELGPLVAQMKRVLVYFLNYIP